MTKLKIFLGTFLSIILLISTTTAIPIENSETELKERSMKTGFKTPLLEKIWDFPIISMILDLIRYIIEKVQNLTNRISEIRDAIDEAKIIIENIIQNIKEGLQKLIIDGILGMIRAIIDGIKEFIQGIKDIINPSF